MRKLLMEFIGTFFFILTIAIGAGPIAVSSMLMAWLYIGFYVSGGHFNPMVTLAVMLTEGITLVHAGYYMLAQIAGGFLAYAAAAYLHTRVVFPEPNASVSLAQAFIVEILLAFVFASVVLHVAMTKRFHASTVFGFAIGFTIPALMAFGGPISGGLFNPAISIGSTLFGAISGMSEIMWSHLGMYVIGAFLGGALAAYAFIYFVPERSR
ncbi:MAG: aquaporin Z [Candidatus Dependentiae bacterium ADurb.Bin331]|nr:MAG: aquaporin Z [Candidatus Dependentiae bacterium ADurb.Bin331]